MRLSDYDKLARDQHGLLTRTTTRLSNDSWRRAIEAGTFVPVHRDVVRVPGAPTTNAQRIAASVMAVGDGALASHRSAAYLWGLVDDAGHHLHVIDPDGRRHPSLADTTVHRPSDRRRLRPFRKQQIPCTTLPRTLCDLGINDPDEVSGAVGRALSKQLIDLQALRAVISEHSKHGRAGIPILRRAVEEWTIDHRPADSVLELAFADLAHRYRLPPFSFHERLEGWEVDFRFVGTTLVVECDGWATHGADRAQFERDRQRDADLVAAGWRVVRRSYRSIVHRPAETATLLRRALDVAA